MRELFEDLLAHPRDYLQAREGRNFEQRFCIGLDNRGYNRLADDDIDEGLFTHLKQLVLDWIADEDIPNPLDFRKHYLFQPNGEQQYPDILAFDGDRVLVVELKFSRERQGKPMWNTGVPRPRGIYVFGAYGRMDITFFRGGDVLAPEEAAELHGFFDQLRVLQETFNREQMAGQEYGFSAYVRKAFDQKRGHNPDAVINFFDNPKREALEQAVLDYLPTSPPPSRTASRRSRRRRP